MNILDTSIITFIILEITNIFILYFKPGFKYGNSLSVFKNYTKNLENDEINLFNKYMANWVANTKVIFIALLIIIVILGNNDIKLVTSIVLIPCIFLYFIRLHPIIKQMDKNELLNQKGYSTTLASMIISFILLFILSIIIYLV